MVRYKKIGYVELNVSDINRSKDFYQNMVGLQIVDESKNQIKFRCDTDPYSIVLHQSDKPGHFLTGLILESDEQIDVLLKKLNEIKIPFQELSRIECDEKEIEFAIRMREPYTNAMLEFCVQKKKDKEYSFFPTHTKIQRIGHVVFYAKEYQKAIDFFRDILNFRESDSIGEGVTFMRPFPNPYHHGLGIARGNKPLLHHLNFMVSEIDDIGKALHRSKRLEVPILFGPGRHPASGSVFLYFLEPDGMTLEYSFGMEEFDELNPRAPRKLDPIPESLDTWGSPRDPRFASAGEII